MVGVVLVCGLVAWLFLGVAAGVFSGTDCLELRVVVVCVCWVLRGVWRWLVYIYVNSVG